MRLSPLGLLACGLLLAIGLSAPGGDKKDDMKRIQGTWVVDPVTFKGFEEKEGFKEFLKEVRAWRFTFDGDRLTIRHPPGSEEKPQFRLDPSKEPKQIDLSDNVQGIYELDGDTLKLCWDKQAQKRGRPTKFAHGTDDDRHYYVLRRADKGAERKKN